ncbi:MAG TPA: MarR family transcriptional regulator [Rugosimonospora sp.]|nr:MarR family transcriptional regulator [Rugosimonospora sp.]
MHQSQPTAEADQRSPLTIYLVKQTEAAIRAHLDLVLRPHNLATAQYTALTVLRHREGLSSAQLARRSFVKPQTMHEMVVGLERQGLIERRPSEDRRHVLLIRLTAAGRRKLADCQADVDRIEHQMVRTLDGSHLAALRDLLERCHLALSDPLPNPDASG